MMLCSLGSIYFSAYHDQEYMLESAHGIFCVYPAPNIGPKNVAVVRVNGTHMNVTWGKLSLEKPVASSQATLLPMTSMMDVKSGKLGLNCWKR